MRLLIIVSMFAASAASATVLDCKQDGEGKSRATLIFEGKKLISAEVRHTDIRRKPTVNFNRNNSEFFTGSNSSEIYQHIRQDTSNVHPGTDVSLSYKIKNDGRELTLEEALVGPQYALNGSPYGKLRFDFTIPGLNEDYGWTYFYYCNVK